jgi:hypothetical protein
LVDLLGGCVDHTIPANRSGTVTRTTIWEFFDSYLLASERGRWRILGDVVHA